MLFEHRLPRELLGGDLRAKMISAAGEIADRDRRAEELFEQLALHFVHGHEAVFTIGNAGCERKEKESTSMGQTSMQIPHWMHDEFLLSKACWFFAKAMTSTPT